jgi:hypothetical protein
MYGRVNLRRFMDISGVFTITSHCIVLLLYGFWLHLTYVHSFLKKRKHLKQNNYLSFVCKYNYTLYKNPGFWLVSSRCIFRVFSYLGLISFNFTADGVFAWGFNFFSLCAVVFAKMYFTFLPSRASNRQIHSEYFFFTFIHKVTWLIKIEIRKCSDVNVKKIKIPQKAYNKLKRSWNKQ